MSLVRKLGYGVMAVLIAFDVWLMVVVTTPPKDEKPKVVQFTGGAGGARDFVEYIDGVLDQLPAEEPMSVTQDDITLWALETLPMFGYEGLLNYPVVPSAIELVPTLSPMEHNHILGRALCTYPGAPIAAPNNIEMNFRTANPHSAWFGEGDRFLPTLIHEMIHIQGVCGSGEASETATQLVTLEVLAALVNGGNEEALRPLLQELRDIALASLQLEAWQGTDEDFQEYREFRDTVLTSAVERARFEKSIRFWSQSFSHKAQLTYILRAYNDSVWRHLNTAFADEDSYTGDLYIPEFGDTASRRTLTYDGRRPFKMDDLVYFIENAEDLVREFDRR